MLSYVSGTMSNHCSHRVRGYLRIKSDSNPDSDLVGRSEPAEATEFMKKVYV